LEYNAFLVGIYMGILGSIIASVSVNALLIYLLRAWISERIKQSIGHEYAKKLEVLKAELSAHSEIEIEKLRSTLREQEIRFYQIHKDQVEATKLLYSYLVEAKKSLSDALWSGLGRDERTTALDKAHDSGNQFRDYFNEKRILFPSEICHLVDDLWEEMKIAFYGQVDHHWDQLVSENSKARKLLRNEIPRLKRILEDRFRELLGTESKIEDPSN